jgi:predicted unusual protein kinase regulating ubiquinone biosynthesis (AarF/ABC1/UbiB family)
MMLLVRLVRALWVFGVIFFSYMGQLALIKVLEVWEKDPVTGREEQRLPDWVRRRMARLDQRNAKRLLNGMLELRGVYIKLGQVLSIMGGFLPRAYTKELEQLQDAVPPQPYEAIERAFVESFNMLPSEAFARFDKTPLAAASLGQVHVAWLRPEVPGGEERKVAVKVLYPGIRAVIAVDMQVIRLAVLVYQFFVPVRGLERVYSSLVDLTERETEYLHEARCMDRMRENFAREKDILFPEVISQYSSSDVLTMTFMEGTKINKLEELRAQNIDTRSVAIRFVESFYKQIFIDRFFHADPHPGNFLVQPGRNPQAEDCRARLRRDQRRRGEHGRRHDRGHRRALRREQLTPARWLLQDGLCIAGGQSRPLGEDGSVVLLEAAAHQRPHAWRAHAGQPPRARGAGRP